jgi:ATP-dependent 26S proteasome regulatory subunit
MRRWDTELRVEIAVPNDPIAIRFAVELLDTLTQAGRRAESLRGQVLQIVLSAERGPLDEGSIDFAPLELRQIDREHIILDDQTFELFERNTIGFMSHRDALQQLGFSAKKGVLLYGPPGTGKTLLANYLLSNLEGFTRLVLSANTIQYLPDAMALVREVGPSVVVLEDVDLIAEPGEKIPTGLDGLWNFLLNEMEGLASESTVLFLLTTNQLSSLESVLVARPGILDQAIEIDLPDHRERCRLLEHYSGNLAVAPEMVVATSRRVGKVSAAFVKELVRRAAQVMLEEGGARLEESFLLKAHEDMVRPGKKVGVSLVGGSGIGFS